MCAVLSLRGVVQAGEMDAAKHFTYRVSLASKEHQICLRASTRLASMELSYLAAAAGSSLEPVSTHSSSRRSALAAKLPCARKAAPEQAMQEPASASSDGGKAHVLCPLATNAPRPPPPPPKQRVHAWLQVALLHVNACECC